jgi:hypothetical protein
MVNYTQTINLVRKLWHQTFDFSVFIEYFRQKALPLMPKGRMADIVRQADCLGKIFIQSKTTSNSSCGRGDKSDMIHSGTDMVILRKIKDLGLMSQASERLRVDNSMNVPLKVCAKVIWFLPSYSPLRSYCRISARE